MEVRGLGSVGSSAPISRPPVEPAVRESGVAGPAAPPDEVEISALGRMLDDASRTPGVREQRLAQIKAAIENGSYETPEKLQIALDRLIDRIGQDNAGG
jgi:anti-sigma28 factor (negative regulator of flagellin synthesis)